ncbi:hypothetical protein [Pseudomonas aeruginosa]|uniref:hypothetical protein n=1 Tax=Pseudomonas aeruginosa TaxID=287 RepID=UPI00073BEBA9|nr:hypothetical protein [Pseudomonas aeruginosa]PNN33407.1 hypothetical protein AL512_002145 [Pseudomonas aeruginosa]HEJ9768738.1 hypothetical protein [Pseudomonas aeruginosa]HEO1712392.1 hypothetical protein [Pseudomonas aeruginosa]
MSKHTPGPWMVDYSEYLSEGGGLCVMHGNDCIAVVGDFNPEQPIDANAKLIAAAPELLEALKWVIERNDAGQFIDGECMKSARAAIAKATA